jgi:hypothetical protein
VALPRRRKAISLRGNLDEQVLWSVGKGLVGFQSAHKTLLKPIIL